MNFSFTHSSRKTHCYNAMADGFDEVGCDQPSSEEVCENFSDVCKKDWFYSDGDCEKVVKTCEALRTLGMQGPKTSAAQMFHSKNLTLFWEIYNSILPQHEGKCTLSVDSSPGTQTWSYSLQLNDRELLSFKDLQIEARDFAFFNDCKRGWPLMKVLKTHADKNVFVKFLNDFSNGFWLLSNPCNLGGGNRLSWGDRLELNKIVCLVNCLSACGWGQKIVLSAKPLEDILVLNINGLCDFSFNSKNDFGKIFLHVSGICSDINYRMGLGPRFSPAAMSSESTYDLSQHSQNVELEANNSVPDEDDAVDGWESDSESCIFHLEL